MPRRLRGGAGGAPRVALHDALRPAAERAAVARPRVSRRRADARGVISRLAIVGTGLIGASVGLAAKRAGVESVAGFDPDPGALAVARERGAVDEAPEELAAALDGAELAVV